MFRRVHLRPYSLCARFGRSRTSRPLLFLMRNILSIRKSRTLGSSPPQSASSNCFPATSWKRSSSLPPSLSNSQRSLTFLLPARPRLLSGLWAASRHRTSHCHPERGRAIPMPARVQEPCVSACGAGALARVPARAFQTPGHSPPRTLRFRLWRGRPRPRPGASFSDSRPLSSLESGSLLAKFPSLHLPAALLPRHRYAAHRHHHSIALDHTVRHRLARLAPLHLLDAAIGNVHSSHMATSRHRQRRYQCRHFYLAVHSRAASCSIRNDCRQLKVAVISLTLLARVPSRLTVQVPAPVQAPLQPAKLWPEKEWAVKVTLVPFSMVML